jgi:sterol 3beta-glucosyltransferase
VEDTPAQQIPDVRKSLHLADGSHSPRDLTGHLDSPVAGNSPLVGHSPLDPGTPILKESVKATLLPLSPSMPGSGRNSPRPSGEFFRSRPSGDFSSSFDLGRQSLDVSRELNRRSFDVRRSASGTRMSQPTSRRQSRNRLGDLSPQTATNTNHASSDSFVHSIDRETKSSVPNFGDDDSQASASQILNRSDVFHSPTITRLHDQSEVALASPRRRSTESAKSISAAELRIPPRRSKTQAIATNKKAGAGDFRDSESEASSRGRAQYAGSTPTLQDLVKAGQYPLQRAAGFAGYLKNRSKRMSSLLATESMGYIEKVSGMWAGGRQHYDRQRGDEQYPDDDDEIEEPGEHGQRFLGHFALPPGEVLRATYFGYLQRVLPLYGKIYISDRHFCFRSLLPGTRTKLILPLKDIENVDKEKGFRFGYSGLVVVVRGHEEIFFEFSHSDPRDDCCITLLESLETNKYLRESGLLSLEEKENVELAKAEHKKLQEARATLDDAHDSKLPTSANEAKNPQEVPPILFDDPRVSIINFKPTESLRITCLTIGSRGDVQPYIALCKGLLADGHRPRIATHAEFQPWVEKHGIEFACVEGDPAELMRICVENGMFTYSFLKEASVKFRGWIDELLSSAWIACQDSDVLIESPSAMAGIHIAEALQIPYFRAFTMPWTRTRAYPHAFAVPEHKMGGAYNYFTYVMFDNVFWKAIAGQVNRWRKKELGLRSTGLDKLQPNKVPFMYNFSPHVVVPPLDYSDWIRVTGYWFLDEATDWSPPVELTDFIKRAREDGKKIVYVGFGSIVVSDPEALTKTVIDSVLKADVRCILSKGWSDRLGDPSSTKPEVPLPPEILQIKSAPHDWLFKQIDAAAHHGGAGTTGASLRAGLPTIVKPFFGDQFFFGGRIEDLGVGICIKKLNVSVFARALWEATHSERMISKANILGEQIRKVSI